MLKAATRGKSAIVLHAALQAATRELHIQNVLSLWVINTIVFIPKVLSSRGGVFLFFFRVYRRRVVGKCLLAKFCFPTR